MPVCAGRKLERWILRVGDLYNALFKAERLAMTSNSVVSHKADGNALVLVLHEFQGPKAQQPVTKIPEDVMWAGLSLNECEYCIRTLSLVISILLEGEIVSYSVIASMLTPTDCSVDIEEVAFTADPVRRVRATWDNDTEEAIDTEVPHTVLKITPKTDVPGREIQHDESIIFDGSHHQYGFKSGCGYWSAYRREMSHGPDDVRCYKFGALYGHSESHVGEIERLLYEELAPDKDREEINKKIPEIKKRIIEVAVAYVLTNAVCKAVERLGGIVHLWMQPHHEYQESIKKIVRPAEVALGSLRVEIDEILYNPQYTDKEMIEELEKKVLRFELIDSAEKAKNRLLEREEEFGF